MGFATTLVEMRLDFEKGDEGAKRCVGRDRQANRSRPGLRGTGTIRASLRLPYRQPYNTLPKAKDDLVWRYAFNDADYLGPGEQSTWPIRLDQDVGSLHFLSHRLFCQARLLVRFLLLFVCAMWSDNNHANP